MSEGSWLSLSFPPSLSFRIKSRVSHTPGKPSITDLYLPSLNSEYSRWSKTLQRNTRTIAMWSAVYQGQRPWVEQRRDTSGVGWGKTVTRKQLVPAGKECVPGHESQVCLGLVGRGVWGADRVDHKDSIINSLECHLMEFRFYSVIKYSKASQEVRAKVLVYSCGLLGAMDACSISPVVPLSDFPREIYTCWQSPLQRREWGWIFLSVFSTNIF